MLIYIYIYIHISSSYDKYFRCLTPWYTKTKETSRPPRTQAWTRFGAHGTHQNEDLREGEGRRVL